MTAAVDLSRGAVLDRARQAVEGRGGAYGPPAPLLRRAAALWSIILGVEVRAFQVALCQDAWKTARILETPLHADSWDDKAGYAAIGAETAAATEGGGQ